ncbi:MAG: nucleotidyl transferase AbiEii/AbiGii toxin family protein [bacterium]
MTRRGFYLADGTAVALHLGHRRSIDLDWFITDRMEDALQLSQALREEGIPLVVGQFERGTLHATVAGVRVTVLEYRYPHLKRPALSQELGCRLASLDDLACMKLSAIAQRGARKDFIDLYALLQEHKSLKQMLRLYSRKFAIDDFGHVLYALAYFDDAEREPMSNMLWKVNWRQLKEELQKQVKTVAG